MAAFATTELEYAVRGYHEWTPEVGEVTGVKFFLFKTRPSKNNYRGHGAPSLERKKFLRGLRGAFIREAP